MAREIKFRAWHEYGAGANNGPMEPGMIYDDKPGDCLHWKNQGQKILDVMQFTGLKDSKDQEIYEGDICFVNEHWEGDVLVSPQKMTVVFEDAEFILSDGDQHWECLAQMTINNYAEIIGNIHEHSHLLEEK